MITDYSNNKHRMHTAYILTGGNLGDRVTNLQNAKQLIGEKCGIILVESSLYETAAWGLTGQPDFLNQVIVIQTQLTPALLMQTLLLIEEKMGRKRTRKFGPRIIDLDILLIDDLVINIPLLTIPHPALTERKFALVPLHEVSPTLIHPVEKKSVHQLLLDCTDELDVQKYSVLTH